MPRLAAGLGVCNGMPKRRARIVRHGAVAADHDSTSSMAAFGERFQPVNALSLDERREEGIDMCFYILLFSDGDFLTPHHSVGSPQSPDRHEFHRPREGAS